jgi:hypothetical protein
MPIQEDFPRLDGLCTSLHPHRQESGGPTVVREQARLRCTFLPLAVLCIGLVMPMPSTAAAGTAAQAKVDCLGMGLVTLSLNDARPWLNGTADQKIQHNPMLEWLVEVDAASGQSKPWLAESWQVASDGRSLWQLFDPKARAAQLRKIGTYKFENLKTIPLFNVFIEFIVDWLFSGCDGGISGIRG